MMNVSYWKVSQSLMNQLHLIQSILYILQKIGSLFLNNTQSGFYFEKFPNKLPNSTKYNRKICILAVNSGKWFWIKSLFLGKFATFPGLKLYGKLGEKREANKVDLRRLKNRMKLTKGLKGHTYLWTDMQFVRDITFSRCEKIQLGEMTN